MSTADGQRQTIEEIEARAAAIDEAERDALRRLAAFLRELAVELPVESKLPLEFAKSAKKLELWTRHGDATSGYWCSVAGMVSEAADGQEEKAMRALLRAAELFPDDAVWGEWAKSITNDVRDWLEA